MLNALSPHAPARTATQTFAAIDTPSSGRVRRRLLATGLRRSPHCPERARLLEQVESSLRELDRYRPPRARLATPPPVRRKPRVSLAEARLLAAEWAAMCRAPERAEDPDA